LVLAAQTPQAIHLNVELVQIPVTVTNANNRFISDLHKENFRIWEDRVEQNILYFSTEDAPMSLMIVLDISGSMANSRAFSDKTAAECLKTGVQDDQFSLIVFSSRPEPATEFTTDIRKLQSKLLFLNSKGTTALYDAVYDGLVTLDTATNPRKALVVISDGYENHSRHSASDIKKMVREKDVQIYTIGNSGDGAIRELTQITGGRALLGMGTGLANICSAIVRELKNQFVISYKSTNLAKDGSWRKVRVQLTLPEELQLSVRAKTGYFAGREN
jgi:Ca-activated chloride channel family protein